jgi:hypothetical protein
MVLIPVYLASVSPVLTAAKLDSDARERFQESVEVVTEPRSLTLWFLARADSFLGLLPYIVVMVVC